MFKPRSFEYSSLIAASENENDLSAGKEVVNCGLDQATITLLLFDCRRILQ